jgi:hypothetical protein
MKTISLQYTLDYSKIKKLNIIHSIATLPPPKKHKKMKKKLKAPNLKKKKNVSKEKE